MRRRDAAWRDLWLGGVISLGLHLGLGAVVAVTRVNGPGSVAETLAAADVEVDVVVPVEPDDPAEIRLGIERSDAQTEAWLGFDSETEHAAPGSEVDQSAMTLAEGAASEESEPDPRAAANAAEPDPTNEPPITAAPVPPRPSAAEAQAARTAVRTAIDTFATLADAAQAVLAAAVSPAATDESPERHESQTGPVAASTPAAPAFAGGADGAPGVLSDRESVAAALRDAPVVIPGRVLAAQGLEISTRRPRWSKSTLATASPRNPVVRITFGRDGRVLRAEFLRVERRVLSTGYADVDEPLMNAIYRWTATGKVLAEVPSDDPDAGLSIVVRVILVG